MNKIASTEIKNIPAAIKHVCARTKSRYSINGVKVSKHTNDTVWLSATNGHMAVATTSPAIGELDTPDPIPASLLPDNRIYCRVDRSEAHGYWYCEGRCEPIDTEPIKFPPIHYVLPDLEGKNPKAISLSANYLKAVADALEADNGEVVLIFTEPNKPIVVISNTPNGVGVVMPRGFDINISVEQYTNTRAKYLADHKAVVGKL